MGLLERASMVSRQRGYDYYIGDNVKSINKTGDNEYEAIVRGSGNATYSVKIDTEHTTKSKCNCPHADGKRIICKHIVATYFAVLPEEAERYYAEAMAYEEDEEKRADELADKVCDYVWKMKKKTA